MKGSGMSPEPTRYRVYCPEHGGVYLTRKEYDRQMMLADERWECPVCQARAEWDDENYEGDRVEW